MKYYKITVLFILLITFRVNSQNQKTIYKEIEEKISEKDEVFYDFNADFTSTELIGKLIKNKTNHYDLEDRIYFVNNKYYLKINHRGEKTLASYKFKTIKNIPLVVLLDERGEDSDYFDGLIVKKNGFYEVDWNYSYNHKYNIIKHNNKDKIIPVCDHMINDFNIYNPDLCFEVLNTKIGANLKDKKITPNHCDSLKIYKDFFTVFNSGNISLYNLNGKLLGESLKDIYAYSTIYHQIIDSENNMYFIDHLGKKHEKPIKYRTRWGNDTDQKRTTTYYSYKNKILKIRHNLYSLNKYESPFLSVDDLFKTDYKSFKLENKIRYILFQLQKDALIYNKNEKTVSKEDIEKIIIKRKFKDLFFLKQLFEEEKYIDEISYYLLSDFNSNIIKLPKSLKETRFINNKTKISAEDYWFYRRFYGPPLNPNYIITKRKGKFGIWDIEKNKTIIPFNYEKITPKKETHLLLEKNNLYTYYPYVDLTPKYEYLSDFNEYYAKFKYPNGKEGWLSRKGIEYYYK